MVPLYQWFVTKHDFSSNLAMSDEDILGCFN